MNIPQTHAPILFIFFLIFFPLSSHADFEAGVTAYDQGDYAAALQEFLPLAQQGHIKAQFNMGLLYEKGQGVPQDLQEAYRWYYLAGAQGDAYTQNVLGKLFEYGQGVPQDYIQAIYWYGLAAGQGLAEAQFHLGFLYVTGTGVPQSFIEAEQWYRLAAQQGMGKAQHNMGYLYHIGRGGLPQDFVQAHMWYNLAATRGIENAARLRDLVASMISPEEEELAQQLAREWQPASSP